ncbi:metal transporting atpase Mta72 [Campylobacter sputorum subsp. bubulus]|uniref:P-type Zn(2+) transporter n=1 Tax=Campylobacter sputorum subsp. sputorum TaxID=32024 RepID=A0A381DJR1_9BACT|nr:heavy metal translocating P-type ATPase [Campylobacter sputorum]ASM35857.1 heavy metal translocating P-type ATPase [Campylobacter sputorum aubsp. sputorum RM3237]KAB0582408.1 heavy metal translocating P-type ATPase [Campylobacter sputorum subsp. sputorum]QEL06047.1 heavy metal translocating P-type ATPase [Campylobacter sputorum subsp. sputorum]SUX09159.1 metal transporting atpase Mta72 [Campylobacter sputorum subsp. bubulus]SUX10850.1 metal transporting atpase Mta72 [Campylobacter sputorum 
MQRQKLKQKMSFKIIHKSKNRVRFFYPDLKNTTNERALESEILKLNGVYEARVNKITKSVVIKFNGNLDEILEQISKIKLTTDTKKDISKKNIAISGTSFLLTPFLKNTKGLVSITAAIPVLKEGIYELFNDGLTSKVLEAMAVGISLSRKDYLAANSTNFMLNIGEYMEESTVHKSDDLIKELAKPNITEAWVEITKNSKKSLEKISVNDIKKGDIVVVGSGETIAIDGYIIEGSASINQVSMTGEAGCVRKERGERVMSGTVVEEGKIKIWTELAGEDTSTQRIKKYIQNSLNEKSNIGLKATKLADKLVPLTLSLAGISYFLNRNMTSVASVLQADYSCALKLPTPVAFKSSISKAGKAGILIKGAKSIEALAAADVFVFDKTGTLTDGVLKVEDVISFDEKWSKEKLLNLTASVEEHYFHPIAEAVVNAAKISGFKHMHHDEVEFIVAHGIKTHYNQKEVIIGSRHFLEDDEKISFKENSHKIEKALKSGHALLYVAYDKKLLGIIKLKDEIRSNAKTTIKKLKSLGVKEIVMLTGDVKDKANSVADELDIDTVYAELLPTQKSQIIENLIKDGKNVAFCGDGINDAPSLIKANVGISMEKGADIAKVTAGVSLLKDDIYSVAVAKELANKTMELIDKNFKATVLINSAILFGATIGRLSPVLTAALHNGTTIGLLLNSIKGVNFENR